MQVYANGHRRASNEVHLRENDQRVGKNISFGFVLHP
jgi:hypothetical protein